MYAQGSVDQHLGVLVRTHGAVNSLVVRASDSRPEGLGSMPDAIKYPQSTNRIWDLSDTDQDGFLSKEEFILAMHLVYKALENIPVPSVLPPELISILKRKHSIPGMVQVLPDVLPQGIDNMMTGRVRRSSTPSSDIISRGSQWIVNAVDKAKFDEMFHTLDTDKDGFVTGLDVKDTFLKSGLPQTVLAHIWNLCDIKQNGKLNSEQFALAMYLVQQKIQGIEVPATLYSEMIPPTLRPKPSSDISQDVPLPITSDLDSSGSKELDMISSEIKELQMEKMTLEKDLAQKEADVKIKNGELKNLQNELDALETMLKQLEIQKGEARKRLNDLDKQIDAMKKQKEEQELELEVQEKELNEKRKELNELRLEETKLESQISSGKIQLDALTSSLQSTILQISQMKIKIDQLQEQHRLMSEAIKDMDNAISFGDFRTKLLLYKSLIKSVLTYASETWPLTLRDEEALGIFKRKILCCILGGIQVNGLWRRSNLELYISYKQPCIVKFVKLQRLKWAGDLARMNEDRCFKKIFLAKPVGNKPWGRRLLSWIDCVKKDLNILKVKNFKTVAKGRDAWRKLLEKA
ncbi:epidermal growth factor receptor substrate 15-like 1 [Trichonephila clavipes]|nr:epidermal growth factor receptor substrate 15-like 1 [Trichonephila clavipes]